MDAASFKARLDATKAILSVAGARPNYDAILANEQKELLTSLEALNVRGTVAAEVIQAIKVAGLPFDVEEALISRVVELLSAPAGLQPKECARGGPHNHGVIYQDFTKIPEYIPKSVWECSRHTQSGLGILKAAVALGLRRGTEGTFKILGLSILCATRGIEAAHGIDHTQRTEFARSLKPQIAELAKYAGTPAVFLEKLPDAPEELKSKHPDFYNSVYSGVLPVPNPFDPVQWALLVQGTRCRKERASGLDITSITRSGGSSSRGPDMSRVLLQLEDLRNEMRSRKRPLEGSEECPLIFPNQRGKAGAGAVGIMNPPPLALPPPLFPPEGTGTQLMIEGAVSQGEAAKGNGALAEEPGKAEASPGPLKRLDVASATRSILENMKVRKRRRPKKSKTHKKGAKGSKLKRARRHWAGDADAAQGKKKGKGMHKDKGKGAAPPTADAATNGSVNQPKPKILYRLREDHFQTFYNKLLCKAFPFKNKKEKAEAKKKAEDLGIQIGCEPL